MTRALMVLLAVAFAIALVMNLQHAATDPASLALAMIGGVGLVATIVLAVRHSGPPNR